MQDAQFNFVVVANRLPVDFKISDSGDLTSSPSPGGLVTALTPVMQDKKAAWIGWSGTAYLEIPPTLSDGCLVVPISLSQQEIESYYEGFSNETVWPLYHDVITTPVFKRATWQSYQAVNKKFAERVANYASVGGTVWIHDYQLQLVAKYLRDLRPDLKIGFFNHIPFPPIEIFSQLPWRADILTGLLSADLIGFQRKSDSENFLTAAKKILSLTVRGKTIYIPGTESSSPRIARAAAFPISIDSKELSRLANQRDIKKRSAQIRKEIGANKKIILGVDRLDYTKGILERLKAYQELYRDGSISAENVAIIQVASPTRENVGAYKKLESEIAQKVGRINGKYGSLAEAPVEYLHQNMPFEEMLALYQAADIMIVSSLRDGMNLVAKEFIAVKNDVQGVLLLSEFTGAADELSVGALMINPHHIDDFKSKILSALSMSPTDQKFRMRRLRRRVLRSDVSLWANSFLTTLDSPSLLVNEDTNSRPTV